MANAGFNHLDTIGKRIQLGFLLFVISACGYHLKGTGKPVGIEMKSLAIPMMESTSSTLGFEGGFTRIIREEFISHAKFPLVSKEEASAILMGKIYEIRTEPLSYKITQTTVGGQRATFEETNSRRLTVKLDVRMLDAATGKIIWRERAMVEKASFILGTDPLRNRFNERNALEEVTKRFAERIYQNTMERF